MLIGTDLTESLNLESTRGRIFRTKFAEVLLVVGLLSGCVVPKMVSSFSRLEECQRMFAAFFSAFSVHDPAIEEVDETIPLIRALLWER